MTSNQTQHKPRHAVLHFLDIPKLVFLLLFAILFLIMLPTDPDYYWHLMTGKHIFEQHALPTTDIFSFTQFGKPWVLHEWFFQLTLYVVYAWSGQPGVDFFTAVLGMIALYFIYSTARRITAGSMIASFVAIVFFIFLVPAISPRPQLFSFILFAVFLSILLRYKYLHNTRYLLAMPLLMIVWVNAHGGYLSGIVLLVIFTMCEWLSRWSIPYADRKDTRDLRYLSIITVTTALASAANPDFVSHWLYPFEVLNMEVTKTIVEWQSPDFSKPLFKLYLLLAAGYYVLLVYGRERPALSEVMVPGFFILSSFVSVRHMPLATLALIPYVTIKIHAGLDKDLVRSPIITKLKGLYSKSNGSSKQLGNLEYVLNWGLLVLCSLVLIAYYPAYHSMDREKLNKAVPVEATEFIINNQISGRMFHTYHYGGYLIYKLYPEQKVFIDGRADMYGDEFIQEHIRINSGRHDWETLFNKYNIDYVLCNREAPLRQLLLTRGDYSLVYDDEVNSVLLRNSPQFTAIIEKYGQ